MVCCQQVFRRRRRARDEEDHRHSRERSALERSKDTLLPHAQAQCAKRERVDSCRRCLVRQIGYLKEEWGTGKDV